MYSTFSLYSLTVRRARSKNLGCRSSPSAPRVVVSFASKGCSPTPSFPRKRESGRQTLEGAVREPPLHSTHWIPAFAGMTGSLNILGQLRNSRFRTGFSRALLICIHSCPNLPPTSFSLSNTVSPKFHHTRRSEQADLASPRRGRRTRRSCNFGKRCCWHPPPPKQAAPRHAP